MSVRKREGEFFHDATAINTHRLGLPWSGQFSGNPPRATEFAAISPIEQPWLQFIFAHSKPPFLPNNKANNKLNMWNRPTIPQGIGSRNVDRSEGVNTIILCRSVVKSNFHRDLVKHACTILYTPKSWAPMSLST